MNFSQFLVAVHNLRVICDETALDRPIQPAHKIFSINRRFQQSTYRPRRFKDGCAGKRQREPPL